MDRLRPVHGYGRLQQAQSAGWTNIGKIRVFESLPVLWLKLPEPIDHDCHRIWKWIRPIRVQPLHPFGLRTRILRDARVCWFRCKKILRNKSFGLPTNEAAAVIPRQRTELLCSKQFDQICNCSFPILPRKRTVGRTPAERTIR